MQILIPAASSMNTSALFFSDKWKHVHRVGFRKYQARQHFGHHCTKTYFPLECVTIPQKGNHPVKAHATIHGFENQV